MQESFAELANAEIPCVIVNMMRGQGDYYQATRGGGHGDYRHIVLAPHTVQEAVDLVMLAFHLADRWRNRRSCWATSSSATPPRRSSSASATRATSCRRPGRPPARARGSRTT